MKPTRRPPMLAGRRAAMVRLAGLAGGFALAGVGRARARGTPLLAGTADLASARRVGRLYLAAYPGEADAARLTADLDDALGRSRGRIALRRALGRAVRADMAAGRSVLVDGWVLARTEARLCALAALT